MKKTSMPNFVESLQVAPDLLKAFQRSAVDHEDLKQWTNGLVVNALDSQKNKPSLNRVKPRFCNF